MGTNRCRQLIGHEPVRLQTRMVIAAEAIREVLSRKFDELDPRIACGAGRSNGEGQVLSRARENLRSGRISVAQHGTERADDERLRIVCANSLEEAHVRTD